MRASAILVIALGSACSSSTTEQASATDGDFCDHGELAAICADPPVELTAGIDLASAPTIDAGVSYAIAGPGPGERGIVWFAASVTGAYTLYLGGPSAPIEVCDEVPTCTSPAPQSCMRSLATYVLVAGELYDIELGPIAGGQRVRLRIEPPDAGDGDAARIVFAGALDGQAAPDLYTIGADGSDLRRLTSTAGAELYPSWAPGQTRLAFVRDNQLFTIGPEGGSEQLIAARAGRERGTAAAAWSPDGTQLVYTSPREPFLVDLGGGEIVDESYATKLHLIDADGTDDRVLYDGQGTLSDPAWSPDGTTIAFSAADDCPDCAGGAWFATIRSDGTGYQQVMPFWTPTNNYPVHGLDWSPDGSRWVYTANAEYYFYESPGTIATRAPTDDEGTLLTGPGAWSPRWSPDGSEIAFIGEDGLHVMNADGTNQRWILVATMLRGLDW